MGFPSSDINLSTSRRGYGESIHKEVMQQTKTDFGKSSQDADMSFPAAVRQWLVDDDDDVVYECRNCGTRVQPTDWKCPSCGSLEVAEYDASAFQ